MLTKIFTFCATGYFIVVLSVAALAGTLFFPLCSFAATATPVDDNSLLGGSFIGALFTGAPYTGAKSVDFLVLAVVFYALSRILARVRGNDKQPPARLEEKRPRPQQEQRPAQSLGQKTKQENTATQSASHQEVTVQSRAAAMWGSVSSHANLRSPGSVVEGADVPEDFAVDEFLQGARELYTRLQTAWATRTFDALEPFIIPELMQRLRDQVQHSATTLQVNVLQVSGSVADVTRTKGTETVAVMFTALLRTSDTKPPMQSLEIWHFTRGQASNGMWQLAGIDQKD